MSVWTDDDEESNALRVRVEGAEKDFINRAQEVRRCMRRGVDGTRCVSGWITVEPPDDERNLSRPVVARCDCFKRFLVATRELKRVKKDARDKSPLPDVWLASRINPEEEMLPEDKAEVGRFMRTAIRFPTLDVDEIRARADNITRQVNGL